MKKINEIEKKEIMLGIQQVLDGKNKKYSMWFTDYTGRVCNAIVRDWSLNIIIYDDWVSENILSTCNTVEEYEEYAWVNECPSYTYNETNSRVNIFTTEKVYNTIMSEITEQSSKFIVDNLESDFQETECPFADFDKLYYLDVDFVSFVKDKLANYDEALHEVIIQQAQQEEDTKYEEGTSKAINLFNSKLDKWKEEYEEVVKSSGNEENDFSFKDYIKWVWKQGDYQRAGYEHPMFQEAILDSITDYVYIPKQENIPYEHDQHYPFLRWLFGWN